MTNTLSRIAITVICTGTLSIGALVLSQDTASRTPYRTQLREFIQENSEAPSQRPREDSGPGSGILIYPGSADEYPEALLEYTPDDWDRYIVKPSYNFTGETEELLRVDRGEDVDIISYGSMNMDFTYGKTMFTNDKYKRFDEDKPVSRVIQPGFNPNNEMQLHVEGHVGERLTLYIDHDSRTRDNHYLMQYRAVEDDEVIREINAGEIEIKMNKSKYAVYDDTSSKGLGIDMTLRKDDFQLKAFGSVSRGETVVEKFRGYSSASTVNLREYQYVTDTYYQLEPFKRYDNRSSPPALNEEMYFHPITGLLTFTSAPNDPATYQPYNVNIDRDGFALYMDDADPYNNIDETRLFIGGNDMGTYMKLQAGSDYTINYTTGLISIKRSVPAKARIFAVYTINGTDNSSDPSAHTDSNGPPVSIADFSGKILVFLKYGASIHEDSDFNGVQDSDKNNDGLINLDIYEVRGVYYIGDQQLLSQNFNIQFYNNDNLVEKNHVNLLGRYTIDYNNGIIQFTLREPFRQLLPAGQQDYAEPQKTYTELQGDSAFNSSTYSIKVNYYKESRTFQLAHFNIIPGSIRIKVNGREISTSLYTVDHTSGFLQFTDPNNPLVSSDTEIEIKYEFLPFAGQTQSFVGGFRADYHFNRNLDLGGTLLMNRSGGGEVIPLPGSEPTQTVVMEGDASFYAGEKQLGRWYSTVTGTKNRSIPVKVNAYAEYAKSYHQVNTFGKALLDDMESSNVTVDISMSEKGWILASLPTGYNSNRRGILEYLFYREPDSPGTLHGPSFNPYAVPYSKKPGPFNVATGHISDSIQSTSSQRSLGFKFDFSDATADVVTVATRNLSTEPVDLSGLQYVEVWYRGVEGSGNVDMQLDVGAIDEDSDGDGVFDTEDENSNGFLDYDPRAGINEDLGYTFNGNNTTTVGSGPDLSTSTRGNGVLNSEDLDGNGVFETGAATERYVAFPSGITDPGSVTINVSDTTWQKKRIYLDRASFTSEDRDILSQVKTVRLRLSNTTNATGTIYIDNIKFITARWRVTEIDETEQEDPNRLKVTLIDTYNDEDYRNESFLFQKSDLYKSLYGDRDSDELKSTQESALKVEYDSINSGVITRKFARPMDLRFYKTMHLWCNFRTPPAPSDSLIIRVGSSEDDYLEYSYDITHQLVWSDISLKLRDDSSASLTPVSQSGEPDLKRIQYIMVRVDGGGAATSGTFWLNDIYVSDPVTLEDSAHWLEGEIEFTRPVARTKSGLPILSDIKIKYINKGHGRNFSTVGKTLQDIEENYQQLFTSAKILPHWTASLDLITEQSYTESLNQEVEEEKRGDTSRTSLFARSEYAPPEKGLPRITVLYQQENYRNTRDEDIAAYSMDTRTSRDIYTPSVLLHHRAEEFLWGSLTSSLELDTSFRENLVKRSSREASRTELEGLTSLRESEKRQKEMTRISFDYQHSTFYVRPSVDVSSHEIVQLSGKEELQDTGVYGNVAGEYHLPFIYGEEFKFVERNKKTSFTLGLKELPLIRPSVNYELYYNENRFTDYLDSSPVKQAGYDRAKNVQSYLSQSWSFPILLNSIKPLEFIRNFTITYSRSMFLQESDVPYEGENTGSFDENYGLSRVFNTLADPGINAFQYPPWYFFTGRDTASSGRDYVNTTMNNTIEVDDDIVVPDYTNRLRLIDNASVSTSMDFQMITLTMSGGINQVSERQSILTAPQQVISLNSQNGLSFDLMRIFSFGFFRPNKPGIPYHAATTSIDYTFTRNMLITSNIREDSHNPQYAITFKWDRSSIAARFGLDYRVRRFYEYIPLDDNRRNPSDDIYVENMTNTEYFKNVDRGYTFSLLYETDIQWLHDFFSKWYDLISHPIFRTEYSLILNRYNYTYTTSPEPYDQHMVTGEVTLDLHRNVQGGLSSRFVLERYRNRDTGGVNRELISYEIGIHFSLIF